MWPFGRGTKGQGLLFLSRKKTKIMVTPKQLGEAIIRLRKRKGLSQESLANEAGIDRRYMSDLENGKRNPSLDVLNRITSFFGISLSTLIFYSEGTEKIFNSVDELKQLLVEQGHEDSIVLENPSFLSAICGIDENGRIIYSYEKMIEDLMLTENMSYEDAVEFIDYNTIRAIPYMGEKAPIVIYDL